MFVARLLSLALIGAPQAALAHDFWIQPQRFQLPADAATALTLQVGHGSDRQRSPLPLRRIVRFEALGPRGQVADLRGRLVLGGAAGDGTLAFADPGLHVVALETDMAAQSHLPAERYNAYARGEGLAPALEARAHAGLENADASERYGRSAKALVQVGPGRTGIAGQITRPMGLRLEIVPEVSPYAAARGARLPVRVFYEGRPLANALVKLTDLSDDAQPVETHRTDDTGRATFSVPDKGDWLLNVVWTKPLKGEPVDFETAFSSLSFGF